MKKHINIEVDYFLRHANTHLIKLLQSSLVCFTSLTLACQTQAPLVQNRLLKNPPNLFRPSLSRLLRDNFVANKGGADSSFEQTSILDEIAFEGKNNFDSLSPLKDEPKVVEIHGVGTSLAPLKSTEVNLPLAMQITHPTYTLSEGEIPAFYPPAVGQTLNFIVKSRENWRLELKDFSGSTVYYIRSNGDGLLSWDGKSNSGSLVAPGRYQAVLTTASQSISQSFEVRSFDNMAELELYHSTGIRALLDSFESHLGDMERETEALLIDTLGEFPDAPYFQVQAIPDVAQFRIQQQQIDTPPSSYFEEPLDGDVPKAELDAQNDRIVRDVEVMRQKVNWVRDLTQQFQTKSGDAQFSSDLADRADKIQKHIYGVTTSGGCYNYYSYKPRWKKKRASNGEGSCNKQLSLKLHSALFQATGDLLLKGRVNNYSTRCEEFDFNSLTPDFFGDLTFTQKQVTHDGSNFEIVLTDFVFTEAYQNKFYTEESTDILGQVISCTGECMASNQVTLNTLGDVDIEYEIGVSGFDVQSDFKTQATQPATLMVSGKQKNTRLAQATILLYLMLKQDINTWLNERLFQLLDI